MVLNPARAAGGCGFLFAVFSFFLHQDQKGRENGPAGALHEMGAILRPQSEELSETWVKQFYSKYVSKIIIITAHMIEK